MNSTEISERGIDKSQFDNKLIDVIEDQLVKHCHTYDEAILCPEI
jgi:hypothetical protein